MYEDALTKERYLLKQTLTKIATMLGFKKVLANAQELYCPSLRPKAGYNSSRVEII